MRHEYDQTIAQLYDERSRLQTPDRLFRVLTYLICFFEELQRADIGTGDSLLTRLSARAAATHELAEHLTRSDACA